MLFITKSIIKQVDSEDDFTDDATEHENQHNLWKSMPFRTTKNYTLVWLKSNIQDPDEQKMDVLNKLKNLISLVETFTDLNECIDFVTNVEDEMVFMIISQSIDLSSLSLIQDIAQLHSIYVVKKQNITIAQSASAYKKVKGVFTSIESISDVLNLDIARLTVNLIPFSVVSTTSSPNLDELDQSFMYTGLLKEIILELEHNDKAKQDFIDYYRSHFEESQFQSKEIAHFQEHYKDHSPIWWYTKELFIYSTLNNALRTQDTETIIKMGFFLQDLHREISLWHSQDQNASKIVVYRGQRVPQIVFAKIENNKGGLISFNSFLSTSSDREVSLIYTDDCEQNGDMVGILFRMEIDPSIASTPYVSIHDMSNHEDEDEILFSMHTVFRINDFTELNDHRWEIQLTLTSDNDPQLKRLTDYIRNEICVADGWYRMGWLMLKMGKFGKALEIFNTILKTTVDNDYDTNSLMRTAMTNQIGLTHAMSGCYAKALSYLERALTHCQNVPVCNHLIFAGIYHGTGLVYQLMGEYSIALSYFEKTIDIFVKFLPSDHPTLAANYNSIGMIHQSMGNYTVSLLYFEKALNIRQKSLPQEHPDLAASYNNIGMIHQSMSNYTMALSYSEKALNILEKSLSQEHPDLATNYNNIGVIHQSMGNCTMALSYFEKALNTRQKSLPHEHPDIAQSYNNIGVIHHSMGNYREALSYFEKALSICEESLPESHPNLATNYNNIGVIHQSMGNYTMALSYFEKALSIWEKSLPQGHPDLATNYNNIGTMHQSMGNYTIALAYFEKALNIHQTSLPSDHPVLAASYNNLGGLHRLKGDYEVARLYFEKALQIQQRSVPDNHSQLVTTYKNIASLNQSKGDLLAVLPNFEKTLDIERKLLLNNRSLYPSSRNNFEAECQQIDCEATIVSQMKTLSEFQQRLFPTGRPTEVEFIENIDEYQNMCATNLAYFENLEKVCKLQQTTGRINDLFMGHFSGNKHEENQIIERYLNVFSRMKKVLIKRMQLLTLIRSSRVAVDAEIDELQSGMEDVMISQSELLEIFELHQKFSSPNDPTWVANYNSYGETCCTTGNYQIALASFEKALKTIHSSPCANRILLAKTYSNMAKALDGLGRYKDAFDSAKQAVDTARSTFETTGADMELYENQLRQLERKI